VPTQSEFARTPPDLLRVHTCDGQDSKVLVAVANHWPFSAAFAREALGASAGELWACSGARFFCNDYLSLANCWPFSTALSCEAPGALAAQNSMHAVMQEVAAQNSGSRHRIMCMQRCTNDSWALAVQRCKVNLPIMIVIKTKFFHRC